MNPLEPQHFCADCSKKLILFHELKEICIETQKTLEDWVKNEKIIEEEVIESINETKNEEDLDYLIEEVDEIIENPHEMKSEPKFTDLEVLDNKTVAPSPVQNDSYTEKFECGHCRSYYYSKKGLKAHYRSLHPELRTAECFYCNNKFYPPFLESHIENCKKAGTVASVCPICGVLTNRAHVSRHIEASKLLNGETTFHEKPFECDICGTRTTAKSGMVSHMLIKHLKHRFRCEVCDADFKTPSVLTSHMRKYHPERKSPLKCKFCDFTTSDASSMHRHVAYHTGKKRHKCEVCGREFIAKDVWRDHMAIHSDARPFPCETCKSAFKTKKALGVHMKTHREHEYECPVCRKTFLTNQQMRNHVKKTHPTYELPPKGTIFNKNWRIRKAKDELKELAIKEGVDTAVVESIVIAEPPAIEEKMYFRSNKVNLERFEEGEITNW